MRKSILSRFNSILVLAIMVITISSCGSKRKIAKNSQVDKSETATSHAIKSFELSNLDFVSFSGRAKAKFDINKESHDATANVRIIKDKAIWVSITSLFNIEVARVLITPDSVKVLNKFPKREKIEKPFSYIYQFTSPGVTFKTLQDILIGNVSLDLLRAEEVQVASADDEVMIMGAKGDLNFEYGMNTQKRPFATRIRSQRNQQNLDVAYNEYNNIGGHVFPNRFILNVAGIGLSLKADLIYNRLEFDKKISIPF